MPIPYKYIMFNVNFIFAFYIPMATYSIPSNIIEKISKLELKSRMIVEGLLSGLHKSPHHGFNIEFLEHRQYFPGDDIRYIDWKFFAKSDKYFIKQHEKESDLKVFIIVDSSASMGFGMSADTNKFQYATLVAASLAYLLLKQGDSVGCILFDDEIREILQPKKSTKHFYALLKLLVAQKLTSKTNISDTVKKIAGLSKENTMYIIISDLLDEPSAVMSGIKHLKKRNNEIIIFNILSPEEIYFPFEKSTKFIDTETGEYILTEPQNIKDKYKTEVDKFLKTYKNFCREIQVDYSFFNTAEPVEKILLSYLAIRSKHKRRHKT